MATLGQTLSTTEWMVQGDTGVAGDTGVIGDTGIGSHGDTGIQGDTGVTGAKPSGQICLNASGGWPSTTYGCAPATKIEYVTNNVDDYVLDFDKDTDEFAQWALNTPSDYDGGTVTAIFAWTFTSGSANETVNWNCQGRSCGDGEAIDQAWGTSGSVSDTAIAAGTQHISAATNAITLAGTPAAGERARFRVYRDVSEDDLAGDARLMSVMITFTRS